MHRTACAKANTVHVRSSIEMVNTCVSSIQFFYKIDGKGNRKNPVDRNRLFKGQRKQISPGGVRRWGW